MILNFAKRSFKKKVARGIKGKKFKGKDKKQAVVSFIMAKFRGGKLHLRGKGGKKGASVKNRRQALAIALSTARRMGFAALEAVHIPSIFKTKKLKRKDKILKLLRRKKAA